MRSEGDQPLALQDAPNLTSVEALRGLRAGEGAEARDALVQARREATLAGVSPSLSELSLQLGIDPDLSSLGQLQSLASLRIESRSTRRVSLAPLAGAKALRKLELHDGCFSGLANASSPCWSR
ncbi:MAG: hypothetical protein R3F14_42720 [Polyangiaceae bacterium]